MAAADVAAGSLPASAAAAAAAGEKLAGFICLFTGTGCIGWYRGTKDLQQ